LLRPEAVSGVRPQGAGSGNRRLGGQALGAAQHVLGGDGLRGLRPHPLGLADELGRLLLGVGPLAATTALVELPLLDVRVPAEVVDVQLAPVRVQVPHRVDGGAEQLDVVGDDDEAARVGAQVLAQPDDRVVQQRVGAGEQDAGELDAAALAAGERVQGLVEHAGRERERRGHRGGLGLRGPSAEGLELRVEADVAVGRLRGPVRVGQVAHLPLGPAQATEERVDAARGQDTVAGEGVEVARARVLWQVADRPGGPDGAGVGDRRGRRLSAGEDLRERRLPGPVAADQADLHPGVDPERRLLEEFPVPDGYRDAARRDHDCPSRCSGRSGRHRC
jgi:hypothetical protein